MTSPLTQLVLVPVVALVGVAAVTDLRARRIPNWVTFALLGAGVLSAALGLGLVPFWSALLGVLVGIALMFFGFAVGAVGAGDVKLVAALGAWLGPWGVLLLYAAASAWGLVIVVGQCAATGRLRALGRNALLLTANLVNVRALGVEHVAETGNSARAAKHYLPYAVPVLLGLATILCWPA